MNGITIPTWLFLVLFGLGLAAMAWLVFRAASRANRELASWRPLPDTRFFYRGEVSEDQLRAAIRDAMAALYLVPGWTMQQMVTGLAGMRIWVRPDEWWISFGRKVGSVAVPETKTIEVGPSLKGLAHEMAHILEWRVDGKVDFDHAGWGARGIWSALAVYDTRAQRAEGLQ